jgi:hypothetical protein
MQKPFGPEHPLVTGDLMAGGIGLLLRRRLVPDLDVFESHVDQVHLLARPQHLYKLARQRIERNEAGIPDPAVIGCRLPVSTPYVSTHQQAHSIQREKGTPRQ